MPGGFHNRTGRLTWGFSIGLGGMHDDGSGITTATTATYSPALEVDGHIGGMLSPRFALMFEGPGERADRSLGRPQRRHDALAVGADDRGPVLGHAAALDQGRPRLRAPRGEDDYVRRTTSAPAAR